MGLQLASKRKRRAPPPIEIGAPTIERLRHAHGHVERGDMGTYTLRDSPLERALARGVISADQYRAGEKYRLHWYRGGLSSPLQTIDPNRIFASDTTSFSGMARTEAQAFHRQQFRNAVQEIGMISALILDSVICAEITLEDAGYKIGWNSKPQAIAAATERMRQALDTLCRHWGIG
jgi:hypothetical protein